MSINWRATPATGSCSNGSSISLSKQAGTSVGDWVFISVFDDTEGSTHTAATCTGFNAVSVVVSTKYVFTLLSRCIDGTEGSSFTIQLPSNSFATAMISTISGASATLDPSVIATPNGASSSSLSINSITLSQSSDLVLWFAGDISGTTYNGLAITPPSGFTSRGTNGAATELPTLMVADNSSLPSGATGAKVGSTSATVYYAGVMVGLKPDSVSASVTPSCVVSSSALPSVAVTNGISQQINLASLSLSSSFGSSQAHGSAGVRYTWFPLQAYIFSPKVKTTLDMLPLVSGIPLPRILAARAVAAVSAVSAVKSPAISIVAKPVCASCQTSVPARPVTIASLISAIAVNASAAIADCVTSVSSFVQASRLLASMSLGRINLQSMVRVVGSFINVRGAPLTGFVSFLPSTSVSPVSGGYIIETVAVVRKLDENGRVELDLTATDNVNLDPVVWSYNVEINVGKTRRIIKELHLPSYDNPIDLTHLMSDSTTSECALGVAVIRVPSVSCSKYGSASVISGHTSIGVAHFLTDGDAFVAPVKVSCVSGISSVQITADGYSDVYDDIY